MVRVRDRRSLASLRSGISVRFVPILPIHPPQRSRTVIALSGILATFAIIAVGDQVGGGTFSIVADMQHLAGSQPSVSPACGRSRSSTAILGPLLWVGIGRAMGGPYFPA